MNTVVLRRRLIYICAMVVLLVPLYFLGTPSVRDTDGSVIEQGGTLSQLRTHYNLGQSDIGAMDPASESVRLATLGLRGVASTILWQKAEYYKREKYWDRLAATLNQIAVLQPHFVKVWEFQAHNLSYNVSVEFDDYKQRYEWVKKGIDYLIKGAKYNKHRTEMPYELGWFFGNKMGVADERVQFRELYRNDANFHEEVYARSSVDLTQPVGQGPDGKPDNWLSGAMWYDQAYDMVDSGAQPARSTMMFYRMRPQWHMKYSEAIQSEGYLDDPARIAWERAGAEWNAFGNRQIRTSFGDTIFLNELQIANEEYGELKRDFEEFCGETYEKALQERQSQLTEQELKAYEKDELERRYDELILAEQAAYKLRLDFFEIAKKMPEDKRVEALERAKELKAAQDRIRHIEIYRNTINYQYWQARCEAEQEEEALLARTSMYEANQLLDRGELDRALEKFELAWENWAKLFSSYPAMMVDDDAAQETMESIERYRRLLDQPDLPGDFALKDFIEFREIIEDERADPALMAVIASWPEKYPDRNFLDDMLAKSQAIREQTSGVDDIRSAIENIRIPGSSQTDENVNSDSEPTGDAPEEASQAGQAQASEEQELQPPVTDVEPPAPVRSGESNQAWPPENDLQLTPPGEGNPPSPASEPSSDGADQA